MAHTQEKLRGDTSLEKATQVRMEGKVRCKIAPGQGQRVATTCEPQGLQGGAGPRIGTPAIVHGEQVTWRAAPPRGMGPKQSPRTSHTGQGKMRLAFTLLLPYSILLQISKPTGT